MTGKKFDAVSHISTKSYWKPRNYDIGLWHIVKNDIWIFDVQTFFGWYFSLCLKINCTDNALFVFNPNL